jgi:hypothetical protein
LTGKLCLLDWIYLDSHILLPSRSLKLEDKAGQLAALIITHLPKFLPEFWKIFYTRIKALYGDELLEDFSRRLGYDYLAIHYHWYNRYAERVRHPSMSHNLSHHFRQGKGTPSGIHPDFLRKARVTKVNHTQRTPHESNDIATDTAEFQTLMSIMEDLMEFLQANVSSLDTTSGQ